MDSKLIYIGVISSAYNLGGLVKITSFTSKPENICKLKCIDQYHRPLKLSYIKKLKNSIICRIDGINNRTEAEKILKTKIYVLRSDLPELEVTEYYIEDLIGAPVVSLKGKIIGKVKAFHNFGAGDLIEIIFIDNKTEIYSFSTEKFPIVTKDQITIAIYSLS